jgi:energy-coupling factor transporter ATP-binding protein EcfA2
MIRFDQVGVTYDGAAGPIVRDVTMDVPEGELCLLVGSTGSGKSTLLRTVNGLVPHFSGGTLHGRVTVAGRDTRTHKPRDLADVVGFVGQDPISGFVADTVEDEIAFGMEWLGLAAPTMRRRVEESLDLLGLTEVRRRPLESLSGGQSQRVAIAAAMAAHPAALVLDEPTSALDPQAAEDVLAAVQRLVHDLGVTVLVAEHRLERVVQYVDTVAILEQGRLRHGDPASMMVRSPVAPPVVQLGRLLGWDPLPLSVRDARRCAAQLSLGEALPDSSPVDVASASAARHGEAARNGSARGTAAREQAEADATTRVRTSGLTVRYGPVVAIRDVSLTIRPGEAVALMGRNGAGKSTLLNALVGLVAPRTGTVSTDGVDPATLAPADLVRRVGLVPQQPTDILYAATVATECTDADDDAGLPAGTTAATLARLAPEIEPGRHPRDLSEGQRLMLALAVVLGRRPPVVLLDEPTRGLDYAAKQRLVEVIADHTAVGHTVVLSTHDVELAAEACSRVVILADGEVVADGPAADVVVSSPTFAPQVAKIMAPRPLLTIADVSALLVRTTPAEQQP